MKRKVATKTLPETSSSSTAEATEPAPKKLKLQESSDEKKEKLVRLSLFLLPMS
jgi:hypothetical protein